MFDLTRGALSLAGLAHITIRVHRKMSKVIVLARAMFFRDLFLPTPRALLVARFGKNPFYLLQLPSLLKAVHP